ncbi:MAG: threonine synthase [Conexivisphaera sp.]
MPDFVLRCTQCGTTYPQDYPWPVCERCGGLLEVEYDYSTVRLPQDFEGRPVKQWKYAPLFPVSRRPVTVGEGGTRLKRISSSPDIYLKIEIDNPTKSFKDRGSSVEVTRALELGFDRLAVASTGNMALSLAAYSEIADMEAVTFVGSGANENKIDMIRNKGGRVVQVDGDFNDAVRKAEEYAKATGSFLAGDYAYRKEGQKGVFFEVIDQLGFEPPDYIFIPVGNGTLISAAHKASVELRSLGLIDSLPRLIGVQAEGAAPLVEYVKSGKLRKVEVRTGADAIAVGYPMYAEQAKKAVEGTGGEVITVSDGEMEAAADEIFRRAGVCAELAGAAAYAAILKRGIGKDDVAVAIVSGGNI